MYEVQVWHQDARAGLGWTKTLSSVGGNSVVVNKNVPNLGGGVGQYSIGTFTANATPVKSPLRAVVTQERPNDFQFDVTDQPTLLVGGWAGELQSRGTGQGLANPGGVSQTYAQRRRQPPCGVRQVDFFAEDYSWLAELLAPPGLCSSCSAAIFTAEVAIRIPT